MSNTKFKVGDKVRFVDGTYKAGKGVVEVVLECNNPTPNFRPKNQYYVKWEGNFGSLWYEGEENLELIKQKKLKVI